MLPRTAALSLLLLSACATSRASIPVSASAERTWAYLEQVSNETEWRASVVESGYHAERLALGVDGFTHAEMGGNRVEMGWRVNEFVDGQHAAWRLTSGPWKGGGSYLVEPTPDGCTVTAELEVRVSGWAKILQPILGLRLGIGLRKDLKRLKARLERDDAEPLDG